MIEEDRTERRIFVKNDHGQIAIKKGESEWI